MTRLENIQPRPYKRRGVTYEPAETVNTYNAEISKDSIRIWGIFRNSVKAAEVDFDRTFDLGDIVEYDSYNLRYTGSIVGIGPKSVTVLDKGERKRRLDLHSFCWRNWDFDLDLVRAQNSETMMSI